jgi:hypothetical protein
MMSYGSWWPRPEPDNETPSLGSHPMLRVEPEPRAQPIETFEGGQVIIRFKSNGKAYEINTLFIEPPAVDQ